MWVANWQISCSFHQFIVLKTSIVHTVLIIPAVLTLLICSVLDSKIVLIAFNYVHPCEHFPLCFNHINCVHCRSLRTICVHCVHCVHCVIAAHLRGLIMFNLLNLFNMFDLLFFYFALIVIITQICSRWSLRSVCYVRSHIHPAHCSSYVLSLLDYSLC